MRVDIKGDMPITGENIKWVIDNLNEEYEKLGVKVKNVTCYFRFQNEQGELVEPTHNGIEIKKEFIIKAQKKNVDIAD